MIIKRVYNNNVAMALDERGEERIILGRGIVFGKHVGDEIAEESIEKVFSPIAQDALGSLEKIIRDVSPVYLAIAEESVEMLRSEGIDADDKLIVALTDHISMSLERERRGVPCENPLLTEIRTFYKREYALSGRVADIIRAHMGIEISDGERGFITLHIVNASMEQRADRLVLSIHMVQDILAIVHDVCGVTFDEDSIRYERFVRHLHFFAQRVFAGDAGDDSAFLPISPEQFPLAFECADRIAAYVESEAGSKVSDAERSYLVYHIINLSK